MRRVLACWWGTHPHGPNYAVKAYVLEARLSRCSPCPPILRLFAPVSPTNEDHFNKGEQGIPALQRRGGVAARNNLNKCFSTMLYSNRAVGTDGYVWPGSRR